MFLKNVNVAKVQEWQFDRHTKQALRDILLDKKQRNTPEKVRLAVFNYTHTSFYFYIQENNALREAIIQPTHHEFLVRDTLFDYYYVTDEVPSAKMDSSYTILKDYGEGYGLWKKK